MIDPIADSFRPPELLIVISIFVYIVSAKGRQQILRYRLGDRPDAYIRSIIYWSDEDKLFIAEVPELPGCIAHGDSYAAALQAVNEAMDLWIDAARETGDSIPVPKGRRLLFA